MLSAKEFMQLLHYENSEKEMDAVHEIKRSIEQKYDVEVYKCVLKYNEQNDVIYVFIYLQTNPQLKRIEQSANEQDAANEMKAILNRHAISCNDVLWVFFRSFELEALVDCYRSAHVDLKKFVMTQFDPTTMKMIQWPAMFVEFKTKEDLEYAEKHGDLQRIKEAYYNYVKPHDTFNLITPDKHLLIHFDYVQGVKTRRLYYDLYWKLLEN